jgi:RNA polymerase sigma-70 factor (ECF subfamily)
MHNFDRKTNSTGWFTQSVLEAEPTLYHISKSILKNDFDCADAVQEAILKAFTKLHTLKEEKFFKTWLCRILINECYKIARKRDLPLSLEEIEYTQSYESYQEQDIGLYDAIMELSQKHRLAVTLHYVEGFPVSEVARILKIPVGTVKSRLSKARALIKTKLEEDKEDDHYEKTRQRIPESAETLSQ